MSRAWIDVHYHAMNEPFRAALASIGGIIRTPEWSRQKALEFSDRQDIGTGILSLGVPGAHFGDDAKARDLSRRCNEDLAEFVAQYPKRFGLFAITPMPDVDGACAEAAYALDALKAEGIILLSSYGGQSVGQPQWDPLLEVLDARGAVCFIHPNNPPSAAVAREGFSPGIGNFLGEFVFDTTRAALNLLFNDCLDRFPRIKFLLAHAGGTLPYFSWRLGEIMERQMTEDPWVKQYRSRFMDKYAGKVTKELVLSKIRRFYFDAALSAGPQALASLLQVADHDKILFGSDWPYCPEVMCADMIQALEVNPVLDEGIKKAIARGNAIKVFSRLAG
jgi:predicted TIM-barrel fold metal-dependent hydrolase